MFYIASSLSLSLSLAISAYFVFMTVSVVHCVRCSDSCTRRLMHLSVHNSGISYPLFPILPSFLFVPLQSVQSAPVLCSSQRAQFLTGRLMCPFVSLETVRRGNKLGSHLWTTRLTQRKITRDFRCPWTSNFSKTCKKERYPTRIWFPLHAWWQKTWRHILGGKTDQEKTCKTKLLLGVTCVYNGVRIRSP